MFSLLLVSGEEFGLNALLFILLILSCMLFAHFIRHYELFWLPESGGSMLIGFLFGLIMNYTSGADERTILSFDPNIVFYIVLPPIILDAGYSLKRRDFFQNLGTILLLAILGTVVNNLVFGYLMYGFANAGWIPLDAKSPLECLLFGSLISATDPVATLAMLGSKEVNAHPTLYSLVVGESVLNDAIAIVLYKTFESIYVSHESQTTNPDGTITEQESKSFGAKDLFLALGTFLGESIGSVVLGVTIALLCCLLCKRIRFTTPMYEFILVLLVAYTSYFLAEVLSLSGIMSLFFCAISLAHWNYYNLSPTAQISTKESFTAISSIFETFVFAYMGITAGLSVRTAYLEWSAELIFLTILTCLIARAITVFPLCTIANWNRESKKIPIIMQIPLWFAGLRGGVAFALCLSFPSHTKLIVSSTLMLVFFTTFIGGGLTLPLLRWTRMTADRMDLDELRAPGRRSENSSTNNSQQRSEAQHLQGSSVNTNEGSVNSANGLVSPAAPIDNSSPAQLQTISHLPPPSVQASALSAPTSPPVTNVPPRTANRSPGPTSSSRGLVSRLRKFDQTVMRKLFGGEVKETGEERRQRKRRLRTESEAHSTNRRYGDEDMNPFESSPYGEDEFDDDLEEDHRELEFEKKMPPSDDANPFEVNTTIPVNHQAHAHAHHQPVTSTTAATLHTSYQMQHGVPSPFAASQHQHQQQQQQPPSHDHSLDVRATPTLSSSKPPAAVATDGIELTAVQPREHEHVR